MNFQSLAQKRSSKKKISEPFCSMLPVVNTIYYFAEWRTYRAASYWQVNLQSASTIVPVFVFSIHAPPRTVRSVVRHAAGLVGHILNHVWVGTAAPISRWVSVYFQGEWQVLTKLQGFYFPTSHAAIHSGKWMVEQCQLTFQIEPIILKMSHSTSINSIKIYQL